MGSKTSAQFCGRKSQLKVLRAKQTSFVLEYPEPQVLKTRRIFWGKSFSTYLDLVYIYKDPTGHSQRQAAGVDDPLV